MLFPRELNIRSEATTLLKGAPRMTENMNTSETTATEPKSLPHMENITKAAELFGLTRYAVRVLAEEGKIKAVRIGGRIFVNVDSMSEFFAACTLAPEEGKPVIPAEPAEKPSFARPAKGIRRIG